MGTWGDEFINVRGFINANPGSTFTSLLRARVNAHRAGSSPEEVLYLPPEDWLLDLIASETLVVPESIALRFAPGARLIARGPGSALELRGALLAPVGPIFATTATMPETLLGSPAPIRLTGLTSVHPEWWGAGGLEGRTLDELSIEDQRRIARVDAEAIETAIHVAAFNNTFAGFAATGDGTFMGTPLKNRTVVELLGAYLLGRTVRVGALPFFYDTLAGTPPPYFVTLDGPAGLRDAFQRSVSVELRGRLGPQELATLRTPSDGEFVGGSMLDARFIACLRLWGVGIEAPRSVSCVRLMNAAPEPMVVHRSPHEFRHCRFRSRGSSPVSGEGTMVQVDLAVAPSPTSAAPPPAKAVAPDLEFEGCVFEAQGPVGSAVRLRSTGAVAGADFRGCTFAGEALAMIDAAGFDVSATGCRFENTMIPKALFGQVAPETGIKLHAAGPEGGVDIYLRRGAFERDRRGVFETLARLIVGAIANKDVLAVRLWPHSAINGTLSAQDCRSTSPQFLVTAEPWPDDDAPMRDATVIGLHHRFDHAGLIVPAVKPPAIHWRASAPPTRASLILVGCRFDGIVASGHPRVMAAQGESGPGGRPAVFNYGCLSGDGDFVVSEQISTPGAMAPVGIGYVPLETMMERPRT